MKLLVKQTNALIDDYDIDDIEAALVQQFLETNDLDGHGVKALGTLVARRENRTHERIRERIQAVTDLADLDELVKVFELLIEPQSRKVNGAFFTPREVAELIVRGAISDSDARVLDPACGCGAILIAAARRLYELAEGSLTMRQIVEERLHGVDILPHNVDRAKMLLSLLVLEHGEDAKDLRFRIVNANSLGVRITSLWDDIYKRGGFDAVVGNPPYVRIQNLSASGRAQMRQGWQSVGKGNFNLHVPFFELGLESLRDGGMLALITPNNYFATKASRPLRAWMHQGRYLRRVVDFRYHLVFEGVLTYTAISWLAKKPCDEVLYKRAKPQEAGKIDPQARRGWTAIAWDDLDDDKWDFAEKKGLAAVKRVRETEGVTLGERFKISVGIATMRDNLYTLKDPDPTSETIPVSLDGKTYTIERELVKPIVKVTDLRVGDDPADSKRVVIFPYEITESEEGVRTVRVRSEKELKELAPGGMKYLRAIRMELAKRDRGAKKYAAWYAYGRSQGLKPIGPRIYTPGHALAPRFVLDERPDALFVQGYAIWLPEGNELPDNYDWPLVQMMLQSQAMAAYMEAVGVSIQGGYLTFAPEYLRRFVLPNITKSQAKQIKAGKLSVEDLWQD